MNIKVCELSKDMAEDYIVVQRNRRQGSSAGGLLFFCVLLFAVRKIVLHPPFILIHGEFSCLAVIP